LDGTVLRHDIRVDRERPAVVHRKSDRASGAVLKAQHRTHFSSKSEFEGTPYMQLKQLFFNKESL